MTTPLIEEMVEKIVDTVETVEFLHGVPVKLPSQYKADLRGKARKALTQAHQAGIDEAGKKAVTLFQQALGDTELPEKVWKKIAKVNQILLDK